MITQVSSRTNWRLLGWGLVVLLLAIPAVAMRLTSEVNWGPEDFLAAALLLGGTGIALELVARFVAGRALRMLLAVTVILALLLVWAELAVGILPS